MGKEYHYDAFISYRHCDLDSFVAQNLHRQMEAFKLPANLAKADHLTRHKITRVFRDREELPISINLADNINEALHTSEFLIVICTPRLKESMWCRKEIETFIELHGRDKVLAVLAEGEPYESYPPELLYRDVEVTNEDGTTSIVREDIEPLGADMRGEDKKAVFKAIKSELPRLLAPMFGTSYDGLRQRHREQKLRKIIGISVLAGLVGIAFGTVSTLMMLQIKEQKQQIEVQNAEIVEQNAEIVAQNAEIKEQAEEIKVQSEEIQEQNDSLLLAQAKTLADTSTRQLAAGNRVGAIKTAVQALTTYNGLEMPYTEEAQLALTDSTRVYDRDTTMYPIYQVRLKGTVEWVSNLTKGQHVLVYDSAKQLYLIDVVHGQIIQTISDPVDNTSECSAAFLDEEHFFYINKEYQVMAVNMTDGSMHEIATSIKPYSLHVSPDGSTLVVCTRKEVAAIDLATETEIGSFDIGEPYFQENGTFTTMGDQLYYVNTSNLITEGGTQLHRMNLTTGEVKTFDLHNKTVKGIVFDGEDMICSSTVYGDNYSTYDAYITRYRFSDMKVIWEKKYVNDSATGIVKGQGSKDIAVVSLSWAAVLLNLETGQELTNLPMGESMVGLYSFAGNNYFLAFTRGGRRLIINGESGELIDIVSSYRMHSDNFKLSTQVYGGMMLTAYRENSLTMYGYLEYGDTVEGITVERVVPEDEELQTISGAKAIDYALEAGYADPELTYRIFKSDDKKYTFVVYYDDSMKIYDTADGTLLGQVEEGASYFESFLGYDTEGNYFVGYIGSAMKFSADHKLIATMPHFYCYDAETNQLRFKTSNGQYLVPNYSLNELLEIADEIMVEYGE